MTYQQAISSEAPPCCGAYAAAAAKSAPQMSCLDIGLALRAPSLKDGSSRWRSFFSAGLSALR